MESKSIEMVNLTNCMVDQREGSTWTSIHGIAANACRTLWGQRARSPFPRMFNARKVETIGTSIDQRNREMECTTETGTKNHRTATDTVESIARMASVGMASAMRTPGETMTMIILVEDQHTRCHGVTKLSVLHVVTGMAILIMRLKDIVRRDNRTVTSGIDMTSIMQVMFTKAPPLDGRRDSMNLPRTMLTAIAPRGIETTVLVIASNEVHHATMITPLDTRDTTDTEAVPIEIMMMNTGTETVRKIVMARMKHTDIMHHQGKDIDLESRETGPEIAQETHPQVLEVV